MSEDKTIDLESCMTASTKQSNGFQSSPRSKAGRNCAIAVQHLDARAVLINVTIEEQEDGELVFSSAKKQIFQVVAKSWHQRLAGRLFIGLVVGTARVKKVTYCGPPISPSRVYLQDFTFDPLLTEALHSPNLLFRSAAYPVNVDDLRSSPPESNTTLNHQPAHPQLLFLSAAFPMNVNNSRSSPTDSDTTFSHQTAPMTNDLDSKSTITCIEYSDQEIIVVRRLIDRAKVARLLILLLFFSPLLGIGVGICSHNADVGIAVSAGIFALASFVQGLVAWVQG